MKNKWSINNKNVKMTIRKWLFIDSLSYLLNRQLQTCPMREEKNVLKLPANSDKNESSYSSTHFNCFSYKKLWKQYFFGKKSTHVEFFKYCKKNARHPSALVLYCLSIVFIHNVYQIVFIHYFWLNSPLSRFFCIKLDLLEGICFLW